MMLLLMIQYTDASELRSVSPCRASIYEMEMPRFPFHISHVGLFVNVK